MSCGYNLAVMSSRDHDNKVNAAHNSIGSSISIRTVALSKSEQY